MNIRIHEGKSAGTEVTRRSFLRTGISLLQSSKSKGATVNFGYWF